MSDCSFRDMLNFDFLEKVLGLVSPSYFVYDISLKLFVKLYFIKDTHREKLP